MDQQHGATGPRRRRRIAVVVLASLALSVVARIPAHAASVAPVPLATAASFSVLAGSTVTNTNATVLHRSLGLWPGTDVTGFPPGTLVAPATKHVTNAVAQQAQADATTAYVNAAGRPVSATTAADLGNLTLPGGVYAGPGKGALQLTGPLVLDGGGNPATVFIFQTSSSLITASSSSIRLTNGAQECNVFWQVGSSATLGTGSTFVGTIVALASVTVNSAVTVRGRALARNGAVTMNGDVFTSPTCATSPTTTTTVAAPTTTTVGATTSTTSGGTGGGTPTTVTTTPGGGGGGNSGGTPTTTATTTPGGTVLVDDGLGGLVLGSGTGGGSGPSGVVIIGDAPRDTTSRSATPRRPVTPGSDGPPRIPTTGVHGLLLVLAGLATVDVGVGALGLRLAITRRRRGGR